MILDGWGLNPSKENNAVKMAETPNLDKLSEEYLLGQNLWKSTIMYVMIGIAGLLVFGFAGMFIMG